MAEFDDFQDAEESSWEENEEFQDGLPNEFESMEKLNVNAERAAGYEAVGIAVESGTDPIQAMLNVGLQGIEEVHQQYINTAEDTVKSAYQSYISHAARAGEITSEEQIATIQSELQGDLSRLSSDQALAPYRAKVMATPSGASLSPEQVDRAAVQYYIDATIQSIKDDIGIGDWANSLLIPDFTYNINEISKAFLETTNTEGILNTEEVVREFNTRFVGMPAEAQITVVNSLVDFVKDLEGSDLDRADLLERFLGRTDEASLLGSTAVASTVEKAGIVGSVVGNTARAIGAGVRHMLGKSDNVGKMLDAGNDEAAGKFLDGALRNPAVAKELDTSTQQAADYINVLFNEDMPAYLKGAPDGTAERLSKGLDELDAHIAEANNVVEEGLGLTKDQRIAIAVKEATTIKKQPGIQRVDIDQETQEGFRVTVKRANGTEDSYIRDFTVDDITGEIADQELGFMSSLPGAKHILSPNALLGRDAKTTLAGLERTFVHTPAKVKAGLVGAFNVAQKGLGRKSLKKLDAVLEYGAEHQAIYSYDDLVNKGIGGVRLTPKEYDSYVKTRKVIDQMYGMEDAGLRKELRVQGIQHVDIGTQKIQAKSYKDSKAAMQAYSADDLNKVFIKHSDGSSKVLNAVDKKQLDEWYSAGYRLNKSVKNKDHMIEAGGDLVGWSLTPASNVRRIEGPVLGYRVGHVPRIYDPSQARIFIKEATETIIDGSIKSTGLRTLAYTDNIAEAEAFIKHQEEIATAAGKKPSKLEIRYDREMGQEELNQDILKTWGGAYRGEKRENALPFLRNGGQVAANTVSPIESLQRYINHIASRTSVSAYRLGTQRKWVQQAKEAGALPADFSGGFYQAKSFVESSAVKPGVKGKLLASHNTIEFANRVPTLGEQQFTGALRKVSEGLQRMGSKFGDGMVGKGLNIAAKGAQKVEDSSLVNALRAATFHVNLGMFQASQILVQASGMTIAASINPVAFGKGLKSFLPVHQLDNIKDPVVKAQLLNKMKTTEGQEDLVELYEAWNKSGLYQSIITSNADAYALSTGGPVTRGLVGKALDTGLLPYKIGETINTRTAFITAYNVWKGANKGKKLDDDALKSILQRTDAYRLHMNQADKATWQKGILALPTQFMSVTAKYLQAMIPGFSKDWTALERAKLTLGQAGLFGVAGVPLGSYMLDGILQQTGLYDKIKSGELILTPEESRLLHQGTVGMLVNDYFDIDAVVTSRVAIGQGVTDLWKGFISDPQQAPAMFFLGASGSTLDRAHKSWQTMLNVGKIRANRWDELKEPEQALLLDTFTKSLLDIPSSSRKALWALNFRENPVFKTADGTPVLYTDQPNLRSTLFQLAGFSSQEQEDFYKLQEGKRSRADAKSAATKVIMKTFSDMMAQTEGDLSLQDFAWEQTLALATEGFTAAEKQEIMKLVVSKMDKGTSWGEEYSKWIDQRVATFSENANLLNPKIIELQERMNQQR